MKYFKIALWLVLIGDLIYIAGGSFLNYEISQDFYFNTVILAILISADR